MTETNFTYQIEYSPKKGSYTPILCFQRDFSEHLPYVAISNPLKFKKKTIILELSRQERMQLAKRRVLDLFKQRFADSKLCGSEYGIAFLEHKNRQGLSANTIRTGGSTPASTSTGRGPAGSRPVLPTARTSRDRTRTSSASERCSSPGLGGSSSWATTASWRCASWPT